MATTKKRGRKKATISGYFRGLYPDDNSVILDIPNEELVRRWQDDHPNAPERELGRVKANLANLKSGLRKDEREGRRGGKAKTKPVKHANAVKPTLETLEEHIDDSLTIAKNLDRAGLASVLKLLRRARNEVVWKLTQ